MAARVVAPHISSFLASLTAAQKAGSHGRATITKQEAERALQTLAGAADGATVVQGFLDGAEAGALSEKARAALVDFVRTQAKGSAPGQVAVDVQASALRGDKDLDKARKRLQALLSSGRRASVKDGRAEVEGFLAKAAADIAAAKKELQALAKGAATAAHELDALLAGDTRLKKADLVELRRWLALPLPELAQTMAALASSTNTQPRLTIKYPSDHEDTGGNHHPGAGGIATTAKYPSDNEDGGGAPVGGTKERKVTAAHAAAMRKALAAATASWAKGGVIEAHVGERFATVDLGQGVTGYIPLGALTPTAVAKDPNRVREFFAERAGKRAGVREHCGPIELR